MNRCKELALCLVICARVGKGATFNFRVTDSQCRRMTDSQCRRMNPLPAPALDPNLQKTCEGFCSCYIFLTFGGLRSPCTYCSRWPGFDPQPSHETMSCRALCQQRVWCLRHCVQAFQVFSAGALSLKSPLTLHTRA